MGIGEVEMCQSVRLGFFQEICRLVADARDLLACQMIGLADKIRVALVEDGAQDGDLFCRVGAQDAAFPIRCTMHLCQAAPGNTSSMARLSPSWASEVTQRTPPTPRSLSERKKASHPAYDSVSMASGPSSRR